MLNHTKTLLKRVGIIRATVIVGLGLQMSLAHGARQSSLLIGTWQCALSQDQGETKLTVNTAESYRADGTVSSTGIMSFSVPAANVSASYSIAGKSTWKIEGDMLTSTLTDIKVTAKSNPELDELLHMEDALKAQDPHSASRITTLTKHKLVLTEVDKKTVMTCSR